MARKMISINEQLFSKLENLLPQEYTNSRSTIKRWITSNDIEKDWLKKVTFDIDESFRFSEQTLFSLAFFGEDKFLVCFGLKPDLPESDFEITALNAGFFCAAIVELQINPIINENIGLKLVQNIFTPTEDSAEQSIAYDLSSIKKYFPEILIYKINSNSPIFNLTPALPRIGLFATTKCKALQYLNWSPEALEAIRITSTLDVEVFPYELLLRAVIERKWDHAFLEIYRSIEFLYPFPKINELKNKLKLELSREEISSLIEDVLGWRPLEESSLNGLFKDLPSEVLDNFKLAFSINIEAIDFDNKKAASLVYKLRNECVHFRPIQKISSLRSSINWPLLLQTMLTAAHFCYTRQMTGFADSKN